MYVTPSARAFFLPEFLTIARAAPARLDIKNLLN
jgi:hypothetical protein